MLSRQRFLQRFDGHVACARVDLAPPHESSAAWVAQQAAIDASSAARCPGKLMTSIAASSWAPCNAWIRAVRALARVASGEAIGGGITGRGVALVEAGLGLARRSSARSVVACAIRSAASALAAVANADSAWAAVGVAI